MDKTNDMDSIDFVAYYHDYLKEISQVIRPELESVLDEMDDLDPHDLVQVDSYFQDENCMRGIVWNLFLKKAERFEPIR